MRIVEPALALDKDVSGDAGRRRRSARPSPVTATRTRSRSATRATRPPTTSSVDDQPDAALTNVATPGGAAIRVADGWTAGDPDIRWTIPGPIAPGATRDADLHGRPRPVVRAHRRADDPEHRRRSRTGWGVPAAQRATDGFDYRDHGGATDTVTLTVDLPAAPGREVRRSGQRGDRPAVRVDDPRREPGDDRGRGRRRRARRAAAELGLRAGSATVSGGIGAVEPTAGPGAGELTWTDLTDLAPGAAITITFQARPLEAAATSPGTGNPHVNAVDVAAVDASGAPAAATAHIAATTRRAPRCSCRCSSSTSCPTAAPRRPARPRAGRSRSTTPATPSPAT